MGASSIFMEDQVAPKRCGHMAGKDVIPAEQMVAKIKAAVGARRSKDFFIIARTDARAVHGLDEALRRGEHVSRGRRRRPVHRSAADRAGAGDGSAARSRACRRSPTCWKAAARRRCCRRSELKALGFAMVGLSDHADLPRRAHHRAGARRHQGRQAAREQRRRGLRRVQGHHQLRRMGAHRGRIQARRAGDGMRAHGADDCGVGAALSPPRATERPRADQGAARGRRPVGAVSICRSPSPTGSATSRTRASTSKSPTLAGGAKALQALIGGSADVVTGAFDHTIQMQAKDQPIVGGGPARPLSRLRAGAGRPKAATYKGPADLKGMKIGVTAPGSSTHFMVLHMMAQAGLKPDDASFIGVGAGSTAVAAAKRGEIDALVSVDPVINLLDSEKAIRIVADTRTMEGTRQVYGGLYPAAVLYLSAGLCAEQPEDRAVAGQRLRARPEMDRQPSRRGDRQGDAAGIRARQHGRCSSARSAAACRCIRRTAGSAARAPRPRSRCCASSTPSVRDAKIDLAATYTDAFVDKVRPDKLATEQRQHEHRAADRHRQGEPTSIGRRAAGRCWRSRTFRSTSSRASSWRCSARPAAASPRCSI